MITLYQMPLWLFGSLIVGGFVAVAVMGLIAFKKFGERRFRLTEEMNNDIIFFASAISVFYSLTVGLIAVGVWTTYTEVEDVVSAEAATIGALYRTGAACPHGADSLSCTAAALQRRAAAEDQPGDADHHHRADNRRGATERSLPAPQSPAR